VVNCGMVLVESIGNKGTFYYPKLDLLATAMVLKDVPFLTGAQFEDKAAIFQMRENPDSLKLHQLKNREITVDFKLSIPNLDRWDLIQTISSAERNFNKHKIEEVPGFV